MMRSMFSSVSGLRAQQTKMDIIGNNIANVNTIGFRGSRITFSEVFSQTLKSAGSPDSNSGRGGTNPIQVGLGMGVAGVDIMTNGGSLQRTDSPTDVSIEGSGFFICKGTNSDTFKFTRAGNFTVDKLGNIVTSNGLNVYGWLDYGGNANADGTYTFDTDKPIEPLNIYSDIYNKNKRMIASKATENAYFAGNLDSSKVARGTASKTIVPPATPDFKVPMYVYDNLGNEYKVNLNLTKCFINAGPPISTEWFYNISTPAGITSGASGFLKFDDTGQIVTNDPDAAFSTTPDIIFTPNAATVGTKPFTVKFDISKATMYAADSSLKPTSIDGYPTGNLVTFNIGADGIITGIYSNGKQQPLGLLGLASFDNEAGLQRSGDNMFIPSTNSGDFKRALKAGSEGVGKLNPGTLEMANVDLAKEFTEMIVTQRAFQANSRIMTTVDEMLTEMANMKR